MTTEIRAFAEAVCEELKGMVTNGEQISINEIKKSNDIIKTGIIIRNPAVNISPTIYIEDIYEGRSIREAAEEVYRIYIKNQVELDFDISSITDFEKAKPFLRAKLLNRELNQNYLKDIPYVEFEDLAIVAYVQIEAFNTLTESASVTINKNILSLWNVDIKDVVDIAVSNGFEETTIKGMGVILGFRSEEDDDDDEQIYIIKRGDNGCNGAIGILDTEKIKKFCERKNIEQVVIVPSSVHECLLLPNEAGMTVEDIIAMITEVNATSVAENEILSNHPYFYNVKSGFSVKAA